MTDKHDDDEPRDADELYGGLPPFESSSDTSREAAFNARHFRDTLREQVYQRFKLEQRDGRIDDELELDLGRSHQSISARRRELVLMGMVAKAGFKRRTRHGVRADVYVIAELAPKPPPEESEPEAGAA